MGLVGSAHEKAQAQIQAAYVMPARPEPGARIQPM